MIPMVKSITENGYAIVPPVLTEGEIASLTEQIAAYGQIHAKRNLIQEIPLVSQIAISCNIRKLVEPILGPSAFVARSLFFDKTPEANWKVAWHQDLSIAVRERIETHGYSAWSMKDGVVHVQPPREILEHMLTVRLHLDECDAANGPLKVIPGSHCSGKFDSNQIAEWRSKYSPEMCCVSCGGALLMRPLLLHSSAPATAPRHRRVLHLEFAADPLPPPLQWLLTPQRLAPVSQ